MRMLGKVMLCAALVAGMCCAAEEGEAKPKTPKGKKPNVLALMKPADGFISEAQDAYAEGDSKLAIELYRKAMDALVEVEMAHIAWAATTEFGPVRLRKAFCETRIDGIMLDEAKTFSRMIVVTDTQDLEKKRAERLKKAESDPEEVVPVKVGAKGGGAAMAVDAEPEDGEAADGPVQISEELEWAKDMILVERFEDVEQALIKVLRVDRENREARFLMSLSRMRQGKHAEALVVLDDLLEDNAMDEPTLLLAAGAYVATGAYSKAIDALDRAMKVNPKRPDACINMAWLLLEMRPDDISEAELYYRQAVKMGASRLRDLERRLGIMQE